ncbi:hypothetical protein LOK49_LG04G00250 [Camellia lanceoleosa]|uniref:Uncharacterized protein n=1 Tax=Camellia lanceoleosa TaxID=1840588 RepID=A0ACC0I364_9ERIC|nr:hypothetical protein LOK49_LG04G00250 [Camellia lanceoleosa]
MDWWHKMRKGWIILSLRLKSRKPGVSIGGSNTYGGRGGGNVGSGLSKLREEVQKCGYKDVQVMWNILTASPHLRPKPTKRRSYWKLLFWSNHKLTPSSFSSFS